MMKDYIAKVENKENERIREIRKKKEEQLQELIKLYSKKSTSKTIEPEKKGEILKELMQQYGTQKREPSNVKISTTQTLAPDLPSDTKLKTTPRKISVSPRLQQLHFSSTSTESSEPKEEQDTPPTSRELITESPEPFSKKSSRPRPTTLKLTLSYETDCNAITLD